MIIIDKITTGSSASTSFSVPHQVSSQEAVLVVFVSTNDNAPIIQYNGVSLKALVSNVGPNVGENISLFYMDNPPVGNYPLTCISSDTFSALTAITVLGVEKKTNPIVVSGSFNAVALFSLNVQVPTANSLIIDACATNASTLVVNTTEQTQLATVSIQNTLTNSYRYSNPGIQNMSWNPNSSIRSAGNALIVLEPAKSPSFWNTNIGLRSINDIVKVKALDTLPYANNKLIDSGFFSPTYYQNSFLHTVGRILPPKPPAPTVTNETERPTSQIIIDKVFQGQIASQALSTVTLSLQVSIPSPDAVLVVTGGSVIATGNPWANVQFNGNNLTKIVQTSVAGADAEIWYLPNPPVGTYTLFITSGTGGEIYANAMVLLGVDKKNTNLVSASTTDAATLSTITTQLQNDSQGAFIIDTVSASDSAQPIQDQLQTQVFNATALAGIENVLSSYKIAQPGQVTMSYNLTTAVNAAMVAVAFRQAKPASIWNPNINFRTIDDTVTVAGLDAERNLSFGNYGYKPSTFYQNSFLQTVGRTLNNFISPFTALTDGLISYYKFDDIGGNVKDELNFNPGVWIGNEAQLYVQGKINTAGNFDGSNYIQIAKGKYILGGLRNSSCSLWFKTTVTDFTATTKFIYDEESTGNEIYRLDFSGGNFQWIIRDNGGTLNTIGFASGILTNNRWHHLVVTKQGNVGNIYVDGILVSNGTFTTSDNFKNQVNASLGFGAQIKNGTGGFNSQIDEAGLWQRTLTFNEVTRLYNNGYGLQYPFLQPKTNLGPYYSSNYLDYYQSSFLYTVGRIPIFKSTAKTTNAPLMAMMGVGA